jgi:hypothetical protein
LELQDASEQQAALAVLQSLYVVKPLPELLSELSQEQQLQAAVLADKWQVPHVSSAAAQLLADASNAGGLTETVQQRVLSAVALPDCLQPLLKSLLLSLFGDLEAVWADAGLWDKLLGLSLPAMELLLSCNELKVRPDRTCSSRAWKCLRTRCKAACTMRHSALLSGVALSGSDSCQQDQHVSDHMRCHRDLCTLT